MGSMFRAAFRAVPGLYWVAAVWTVAALWAEDFRGIYIAMFCVVLGTVQLARGHRSGAAAGSGDAGAEAATIGEILSAVFIGIAAIGGAFYGWLAAATIWAIVGGAVIFGILGLLFVSVLAIAGAGFARLFGSRDGR